VCIEGEAEAATEAQTDPGGAAYFLACATWSSLQPGGALVAQLSSFVHIKISKPCSPTLPFFETSSSWKVKNAKKIFQRGLNPKIGKYLENPQNQCKT
jgi:hypothetical protein